MSDPERAVIDRVVDGIAVLLVGPGEAEHHLDAASLPDGAGEGTVVLVERRRAGEIVVLAVDAAETDRRRADARARLDRLRARRSGGRFDRGERDAG